MSKQGTFVIIRINGSDEPEILRHHVYNDYEEARVALADIRDVEPDPHYMAKVPYTVIQKSQDYQNMKDSLWKKLQASKQEVEALAESFECLKVEHRKELQWTRWVGVLSVAGIGVINALLLLNWQEV